MSYTKQKNSSIDKTLILLSYILILFFLYACLSIRLATDTLISWNDA